MVTRSPDPTFSVIIPVHEGAEQLEQTLAALCTSRYRDFEVIVVDDGSTERLEPVVARHGFRWLRLDHQGGPARARDHGAATAKGKILVFIDSDVCIHPDALARIAEAFAADPAIDAVVGTYDDAPADPHFLSQYKNLFHHYTHVNSPGRIETFWSGCGGIRRECFTTFGGFDEVRYRAPAIEDVELGTWMTCAGRRIVLDPLVQCKHLKRWTLSNLLWTDIFERGIPWTHLIHRSGLMPGTLNVRRQERVCVALIWVTLLSLAAALRYPTFWLGAGLPMAAVMLLNFDLYHYLATRRGWWFAFRAAPLHWLYFGYCGLCMIAGTALFYLQAAPGFEPVRVPVVQPAVPGE